MGIACPGFSVCKLSATVSMISWNSPNCRYPPAFCNEDAEVRTLDRMREGPASTVKAGRNGLYQQGEGEFQP